MIAMDLARLEWLTQVPLTLVYHHHHASGFPFGDLTLGRKSNGTDRSSKWLCEKLDSLEVCLLLKYYMGYSLQVQSFSYDD